MRPEQSCAAGNVVFAPFWAARRQDAQSAPDETLAELRELFPNVVDLAKRPDLLYRLHAMLTA